MLSMVSSMLMMGMMATTSDRLRAMKCEQATGSRWAWKWTSNGLEMKLSFGLSEPRHHSGRVWVEEPLRRACEPPADGLALLGCI